MAPVDLSGDLRELRAALRGISEQARKLPWAKERLWSPESHVFVEHGTLTVDLHDLSVRLAISAVERAVEVTPALRGGALVWITGKGRHNVDGRSPLREAVWDTLEEAAEREGWRLRQGAPGRLVLVVDSSRATAAADGRLGPWVWAVILGFAAALIYAVLSTLLS